MPSGRPRAFLLDALFRGVRFFYLLWGGLLLGTFAVGGRVRLPEWVWIWPRAAAFLTGPWARGVLLGLALVMALAALVEVWELVDRLLARAMHDGDHGH